MCKDINQAEIRLAQKWHMAQTSSGPNILPSAELKKVQDQVSTLVRLLMSHSSRKKGSSQTRQKNRIFDWLQVIHLSGIYAYAGFAIRSEALEARHDKFKWLDIMKAMLSFHVTA